MRKIAEEGGLSVPVFPYHFRFASYEAFLKTYPNTVWTLSIAVGAIVIVTLFFLPHPLMVRNFYFINPSINISLFGSI